MRISLNCTQLCINGRTIGWTAGLLVAACIWPAMAFAQQNGSGQSPPAPPQQDLQWHNGTGQATNPAKATPIPNAQPIRRSVLETQSKSGTKPPTTTKEAAPIPVALQDASFGLPQPHQAVIRTGLITPTQQEQPKSPATGQEGSGPQVVDSAITTVTKGMQELPNDAGQVWRTYDISPYTYSIESTGQTQTRPEQAIIDWILKETGTELWFTQPMGILNADRNKLHIYHTPAMQARLKPIVDRFVQGRGKTQVVGLKLMTIASPNWRAIAFSMMQPVPVSSPGVEAWLMSKENAAILSNQLRNRADYQEQSIGDLVISDGQRYTLANKRPINFLRSIQLVNNNGYAQYQPIQAQINEGYAIDFSGLSSLDGRSIEAIIGCDINQIEKMQRVSIDLPSASGQAQPVDLQIPQMVSWNVRERFRWPSDQVLVVSCGVVATPGPQRQALLGIPSLLNGNRGRADALMFVEYKGLAPRNVGNSTTGQGTSQPTAGGNGWTGRQAVGQNGLIPVTPRR